MDKLRKLMCCGLCMALPFIAAAQDEKPKKEWKPETFLETDQLPDETYYLPAPPKESSIAFTSDVLRYEWGKLQRSTERGEQAVRDADWTMQYMMSYFASAFGMEITKEELPETYELLKKTMGVGNNSVRKGKRKYKRTRPFAFFNESTPVPEDEKNRKRNDDSYPSGHTGRGWICALMLTELNPERQNEILKAGYEYCESRVIVGYHYQSDVDAARVASSAAFARLHADKEFRKQLKKAKKELKEKGIGEE